MHNIWTFSALRPVELSKPMPSTSSDPRLRSPADPGEPDASPVSAPSGRGAPTT